jgi:hypothetical protein
VDKKGLLCTSNFIGSGVCRPIYWTVVYRHTFFVTHTQWRLSFSSVSTLYFSLVISSVVDSDPVNPNPVDP